MTKPKFNFAGWKQNQVRSNIWMALLIISIGVTIYTMWTGPRGVAFQNLFITFLVYWVDQCEKEITRRNLDDEG